MTKYLSIGTFFIGLMLGLFIGSYRITILKNALLKQEKETITQQLTDVKNETQLADNLVGEFLTAQASDATEREKLEADIDEIENTAITHNGFNARELCLYLQALGYNCAPEATSSTTDTTTQTRPTSER